MDRLLDIAFDAVAELRFDAYDGARHLIIKLSEIMLIGQNSVGTALEPRWRDARAVRNFGAGRLSNPHVWERDE